MALGVVGVIVWSSKRKKASGETITPEMQAWKEKLHHLMTLPYTEANYQDFICLRPVFIVFRLLKHAVHKPEHVVAVHLSPILADLELFGNSQLYIGLCAAGTKTY